MKFKAQKDKNIIVMLLVLPLVETYISYVSLKMDFFSSCVLLLLSYIMIGFIISAILSTNYILDEDRLIISCLGVKKSISYDAIEEVSEQNKSKFLTVEAPSVSQVYIIKKDKKIIKISPVNRQEFIGEIKKRKKLLS